MLASLFHATKKANTLRIAPGPVLTNFDQLYRSNARHLQGLPSQYVKAYDTALNDPTNHSFHQLDLRKQKLGDEDVQALVNTLMKMPLLLTLDLRDNGITNQGAAMLYAFLCTQLNEEPQDTKPYERRLIHIRLRGNPGISIEWKAKIKRVRPELERQDRRTGLHVIFHHIDLDASGSIDEGELRLAMELYTGSRPKTKTVAKLMNRYDRDGNGTIDFDEFQHVFLKSDEVSSKPTRSPEQDLDESLEFDVLEKAEKESDDYPESTISLLEEERPLAPSWLERDEAWASDEQNNGSAHVQDNGSADEVVFASAALALSDDNDDPPEEQRIVEEQEPGPVDPPLNDDPDTEDSTPDTTTRVDLEQANTESGLHRIQIQRQGKTFELMTYFPTYWKTEPKCLSPTSLPLLRGAHHILSLNLSQCGLSQLDLDGMTKTTCPHLLLLNLSSNALLKLNDRAFASFPKLQILDLSHNQLCVISGCVRTNFHLKALNLSHNAIKLVKNLESLTTLKTLSLQHNRISSLLALRALSLNKNLIQLELFENPVTRLKKFRTRLTNLLPPLQTLDGVRTKHFPKSTPVSSTLPMPKECHALFRTSAPSYSEWMARAADQESIYQDQGYLSMQLEIKRQKWKQQRQQDSRRSRRVRSSPVPDDDVPAQSPDPAAPTKIPKYLFSRLAERHYQKQCSSLNLPQQEQTTTQESSRPPPSRVSLMPTKKTSYRRGMTHAILSKLKSIKRPTQFVLKPLETKEEEVEAPKNAPAPAPAPRENKPHSPMAQPERETSADSSSCISIPLMMSSYNTQLPTVKRISVDHLTLLQKLKLTDFCTTLSHERQTVLTASSMVFDLGQTPSGSTGDLESEQQKREQLETYVSQLSEIELFEPTQLNVQIEKILSCGPERDQEIVYQFIHELNQLKTFLQEIIKLLRHWSASVPPPAPFPTIEQVLGQSTMFQEQPLLISQFLMELMDTSDSAQAQEQVHAQEDFEDDEFDAHPFLSAFSFDFDERPDTISDFVLNGQPSFTRVRPLEKDLVLPKQKSGRRMAYSSVE